MFVEKEKAENASLGHTTKGFDNMSISQRDVIEQPKTLEEWALLYASVGWDVFPLKRDKKPYTENGFKDATTDKDQIHAWWKKWPKAGIGLPTGKHFSVLDFDLNLSGKKDGNPHPEVWETVKEMLGEYPRVRTNNGYHVYFLPTYDDNGEVVGNKAGIGPENGEFTPKGRAKRACDWRGDGGYVVAPPSMYAQGEGTYHWEVPIKKSPLVEAPQVVRDWLLKKSTNNKPSKQSTQMTIVSEVSNAQLDAYVQKAIEGKCDDMRSACEGERNHTLFLKACEIFELSNGKCGQSPQMSYAIDRLFEAAEQSGLGEEEIRKTIDSARTTTAGKSKDPEFKQRETEWQNPIPDAPSSSQSDDEEQRWDKLHDAGEMAAVLSKIGFSGYYDALSDRTVYFINGKETEICNNGQLVAQIVSRISDAGYMIGTGNQTLSSLQNLMDGICHKTVRNPVSEYLEGLPLMANIDEAYGIWHELAQLGGYSNPRMTGIVLGEFVAAEYNRWMHPAKARGQHWAVLIRGGQRGGKSGLFNWLTDGLTDKKLFVELTDASDDRAIIEKAQGAMFAELSEGCLMNKRDEASMKALLSMTEFSGRFAYERKAKRVTVSWAYVITTNDSFILRDPTGASRYACLEFTPEVNRMTPIERSNIVANRIREYIDKNRDILWSAAKTIAQEQPTSLEAISAKHIGLSEWLEAGRESNRCVSRDEDFLVEFLEKKKNEPNRFFKIREAEDFVLKMRDETKDVRRADIRKTITGIMQRYTDWVFKSTLRQNGERIAQRVYVYEGKDIINYNYDEDDHDEF